MGAEILAGVFTAVRPGLTYNAVFGPLSFTAQLLGGVALGALVISLIPDLPRWQRPGGDSAPPAWEPPGADHRPAVVARAGDGRALAGANGSGAGHVASLAPGLASAPPPGPAAVPGPAPPPVSTGAGEGRW